MDILHFSDKATAYANAQQLANDSGQAYEVRAIQNADECYASAGYVVNMRKLGLGQGYIHAVERIVGHAIAIDILSRVIKPAVAVTV